MLVSKLQVLGIDAITFANLFGICKSSYSPTGKSPRVTAYYITTPGIKPSKMPGGNSKWYTTLVKEMSHTVNTRQNK
jgi:hypothetical protein